MLRGFLTPILTQLYATWLSHINTDTIPSGQLLFSQTSEVRDKKSLESFKLDRKLKKNVCMGCVIHLKLIHTDSGRLRAPLIPLKCSG